jgi:hypothetical protein
MSFDPREAARLREAGFEITDNNTATARGVTVVLTAIDEDGMSTTTITLPGGGCLRLEAQHGRGRGRAETGEGLPH